MKNKPYQNLRDAEKAVLGGKFITVNAYIKKGEQSWIKNLTLLLKEDKEKQNKLKANWRR